MTENFSHDFIGSIGDDNINQIIPGRGSFQAPPISVRGLPPGIVASEEIVVATVDSGACDSMAPSRQLKMTKLVPGPDIGKCYGACGGETVTNLGVKSVDCLLKEAKTNVALRK